MKILGKIFAVSVLFVAFSSCDDSTESNVQAMTGFTAALNGASEVPTNASLATGSATMLLNENQGKFNISVNYSGITPTAAHIHKGAEGVSGPAIFPFEITESPLVLTNVTLTPAQETDLKNGLYYINIHSAEYPDGEIRGQLVED